MKRIALALAVLAAPAMAQDSVPETVKVTGIHSLAGIWKIKFPYGISLTIPGVISGTRAGHESFCRMEEGKGALAVSCLPGFGNGTASLEKGRLQLAFCCTALFRYMIDAPIVSATAFMGTYKLEVLGDSHAARTPARGRKLTPGVSEPGGQSTALRTALEAIANGAMPPPDERARKRFSPLFGGPPPMSAGALRSLGPLTQITYLGLGSAEPQAPPGPPPKSKAPTRQPDPQSAPYQSFGVYDVEFANGQRLCGMYTDAGGKPNLLCV